MGHLLVVAHGSKENLDRFQDWVNNHLDYKGAKPYCREVKLFDINYRENFEDDLVSDLKNYEKRKKNGGKSLIPFIGYIRKLLGLKKVDTSKVKRSGKEIPRIKRGLYLSPIGKLNDPVNRLGEEEI